MPSVRSRAVVLVLLALGVVLPSAALGQSGPARPGARAREPLGLDFGPEGVWRKRARRVSAARMAALSRGDFGALNGALRSGPARLNASAQSLAVTGTLRVPVVLFRFADTDTMASRPAADYAATLFGATAPAGNAYTVRTFYEQMSQNLFSMQGDVYGWVTLANPMSSYTGSATGCQPYGTCNGIWSLAAITSMQNGLREALQQVDGSTDFGQFDNDGPDGIPNSADDDGVVDLVVFVQPAQDGACIASGNNHLWSHRYVLPGFQTNDVGPGGRGVFISSYTLQSGVGGASACDAEAMMAVGTMAHETGHGLGLPDLYDTNPGDADDSEGIGHWGLMSSGNYATSISPAHMEGFSRAQLGWVTVRDLSANGTFSLGPYTVADTVFRILPTGSNPRGEYFLLENRQATDSDTALIGLKGPGLLIWHVDSTKYAGSALTNSVNTGSIHALWLMQADGINQLRSSVTGVRNRGDAGDPFPGSSGATVFGPGSSPSSRLNAGPLPVFYLDSIRQSVPGGAVAFRLTYGSSLVATDTVLRTAVMGAAYEDTLRAAGADGPVLMSLSGGALPRGVSLRSDGVLTGLPTRSGTFNFTVFVRSSPQGADWPMRMTVNTPTLALDDVVTQLIVGGSHLTTDQVRYLDLIGNANSQLDVGDFTAWLDATGTVVSDAVMRRVLAAGSR